MSVDKSVIKVFIGSDERMGKAETAIANSISVNTSVPVDVAFMRAGDNGFDGWDMGREPGNPYSGSGWATEFSCFRFAVPELCDFTGRAIYLDVDMIVLGDLVELWNVSFDGRTMLTVDGGGLDVIVWNCERVKADNWPMISKMKTSGYNLDRYITLLPQNEQGNVISREWDCRDQVTDKSKLVHYTDMRVQPWQPWPDVFDYDSDHPCPEAVALFEQYESLAEDPVK